MGFLAVLYFILVFWALIHLVNHLYQRTRRGVRPSLPLHTSPRALPPVANIILKPFHLTIDTTVLNSAHDTLAAYLYNRPFLQKALKRIYDLGNVFGILGMTGAIALLTWTTIKLIYLLVQQPLNAVPLPKRDSFTVSSEEAGLPFHVIIPGITTPLDHLPILLIALFVGQTTHELGHAISAALELVPLNSAGASLFIILPSAFVSLSAATLQRLRPSGRLRIISAGAFHNLFAWLLLLLLGWTGIGSAIWSFAYEDISHRGRVVISVDDDSPLKTHIPVGAVITKLDDFSLKIPTSEDESDTDLWSLYFHKQSMIPELNLGWCAEQDWFFAQDQKCCSLRSRDSNGVACFTASTDATGTGHCIDPVPLLTNQNDSRCSSTKPCNFDSVCVIPTAIEHLLRITFEYKHPEQVLLWSGPRLEVWQQVEVGKLLPRTFLSPIWLPQIFENHFTYLKTVMLSLYLVNLLPLPFLDGDQLLAVVAELVFAGAGTKGQDLEAAERGFRSWTMRSEGRSHRRKNLMKNGVQVFTWTVVLLSTVLTLLRWYKS